MSWLHDIKDIHSFELDTTDNFQDVLMKYFYEDSNDDDICYENVVD